MFKGHRCFPQPLKTQLIHPLMVSNQATGACGTLGKGALFNLPFHRNKKQPLELDAIVRTRPGNLRVSGPP